MLNEFTQSDWSTYSREEINYNTGKIISLLFPSERLKETPKSNKVWWLRYISCSSSQIKDMKNSIFIVMLDEKPFETGLLDCLEGKLYRECCNTVFFIKEEYTDKNMSRKEMKAILLEKQLSGYTPVLMDKTDLHEILECREKKNICFDRIVRRQTE